MYFLHDKYPSDSATAVPNMNSGGAESKREREGEEVKDERDGARAESKGAQTWERTDKERLAKALEGCSESVSPWRQSPSSIESCCRREPAWHTGKEQRGRQNVNRRCSQCATPSKRSPMDKRCILHLDYHTHHLTQQKQSSISPSSRLTTDCKQAKKKSEVKYMKWNAKYMFLFVFVFCRARCREQWTSHIPHWLIQQGNNQDAQQNSHMYPFDLTWTGLCDLTLKVSLLGTWRIKHQEVHRTHTHTHNTGGSCEMQATIIVSSWFVWLSLFSRMCWSAELSNLDRDLYLIWRFLTSCWGTDSVRQSDNDLYLVLDIPLV